MKILVDMIDTEDKTLENNKRPPDYLLLKGLHLESQDPCSNPSGDTSLYEFSFSSHVLLFYTVENITESTEGYYKMSLETIRSKNSCCEVHLISL